MIARDHWGKGYATEAGRASIDFAYNELGWQRVVHVILAGNEPSAAVAQKLGSELERREPELPGVTDQEVLVYAQTRA